MSEMRGEFKKIIGLRNIATSKTKWYYLLFYDLDSKEPSKVRLLRELAEDMSVSYIIYETKNGYHLVVLTPFGHLEELGIEFDILQSKLPVYYSGQTIRVSRKEGEKQVLISYNLDHPVLKGLFQMYARRFPALNQETPKDIIEGVYLVFEKYWSKKQ